MQTTESWERERRAYHARRREEIRQEDERLDEEWFFAKWSSVIIWVAAAIEVLKANLLF